MLRMSGIDRSGAAATGMRIGDLASALAISTKTLRHYERAGLLPPPDRQSNGYRVYDRDAVARARLVVGLRRIGLSIEEVRALLAADVAGLRRRLLGLLDRHIQEIGLQISILQGQHDDLAACYRALLDVPRDRPGSCVCAALSIHCTCGTVTDQADR
jgi:DNA-binding transcriptional MerR regulator